MKKSEKLGMAWHTGEDEWSRRQSKSSLSWDTPFWGPHEGPSSQQLLCSYLMLLSPPSLSLSLSLSHSLTISISISLSLCTFFLSLHNYTHTTHFLLFFQNCFWSEQLYNALLNKHRETFFISLFLSGGATMFVCLCIYLFG